MASRAGILLNKSLKVHWFRPPSWKQFKNLKGGGALATSPSLSVSTSKMAGEYKYSIMIITIVLSFALQNMPTALCRLKGHYNNISVCQSKSRHIDLKK